MPRRRSSRRGGSLIEVIMAILILSVLAVAGAESLYHARSATAVHKQRRLATAIASSRLEDLRVAPYVAIRPPAIDYNDRYLTKTGAVWNVSNSLVSESVAINGQARPMITTVRYLDSDGASPSYDALYLSVRLSYEAGAGSVVILETIKSP